jgi:hypothetical protein
MNMDKKTKTMLKRYDAVLWQHNNDVLVTRIPPSALPYFPEHVISFLADVCLNVFGLFGECACIFYFDCSLASIFTKESHAVTRTLRNS